MSDLIREFFVWLVGFSSCSVLIFAAACLARNQWKARQKRVRGQHSAATNRSIAATNTPLAKKVKWLVFAMAPLFYLLLFGPALSELNSHFQKSKRQRIESTNTVEVSQTIDFGPNFNRTQNPSQAGLQISINQFPQTGSCSCRKKNDLGNQTAKTDISSDPDESDWEASPGWKLSTGNMNDVAEGDLAKVDSDAQID